MRILVVYQSRTGNTKRIAEAIAEELGVEALPVLEVTTFSCDLLVLGSGVYAASLDKTMKRFLSGLDGLCAKKVALFGTSAGGRKPFAMMKRALKQKGIPVHESTLWIPGEFKFFNKGRPNDQDILEAKEWAKNLKQN